MEKAREVDQRNFELKNAEGALQAQRTQAALGESCTAGLHSASAELRILDDCF